MVLANLVARESLFVRTQGVIKELAYRRNFHGLSVGEASNHDREGRNLARLHYAEERLCPGD